MSANGIAVVSYITKGPTRLGAVYNPQTFLTEVTLSGDLEVRVNLRADQLRELIADASKALGAMVADPAAIGHDNVMTNNRVGIDRLEASLNRGAL